MSTITKGAIGAVAALALGLGAGYALGYRQIKDCQEELRRSEQEARSANAALEQQRERSKRELETERYARLLVETRAQLLQALMEVHAKNFGLASQYIEAAARRLASSRAIADEDEGLGELAKKLSDLHERTMLLDARVTEQLQGLVKALIQITPSHK